MFGAQIITIYNKLPSMAALLRKNVAKSTEDRANEGADIARGLCPVDTGALRDSIRVEKDEELGWSIVAGDGGAISYGQYVEFGTVKMAAQPFLTPASEQMRTPFLISMKDAVEVAASG
jgi:HK97 gp10 family phage protein